MSKQSIIWLAGAALALVAATGALAEPALTSVQVGTVPSGSAQPPTAQQPSTIAAGGTATFPVTVTVTGSGNLDAYLTISGLPAGTTATLSPAKLTFGGSTANSQTSTLSITTTKTIADGCYAFAVAASDGGSHNRQTAVSQLAVNVSRVFLTPISGGGVQVACAGVPNQLYVVQSTTNVIGAGSWTTISTNTMPASGWTTFTVTDAAQFPCRFYRCTKAN